MTLGWGNAEVVTIQGIQVVIDPQIMSDHMIAVLRRGTYEQDEAKEIPRILQQGDRIVEIGGGIGLISSLVHKQGKAASIAVYEANPGLIPVIRRNHELNDIKAEVINGVIQPSGEHPALPFYVREDFWASSLSPKPWGYKQEVQVPVVSFKTMLEQHAPTMLIVDIEGGEVELFRNVPLTGIRKVYIELHQKVIGRVGMKRVFDFFSERDFHYDQHHSHGSVVLFSHVLR